MRETEVDNRRTRALGAVALALTALVAAASLTVSLTHAGPRGPEGARGARGVAGPRGGQGDTGRAAETAHLGLCVSTSSLNTTNGLEFFVDGVSSPVVTNGVPSCPSGSFVSVNPQGDRTTWVNGQKG